MIGIHLFLIEKKKIQEIYYLQKLLILTLTLTTSSGHPVIADDNHDSKHLAKLRIACVKEPTI